MYHVSKFISICQEHDFNTLMSFFLPLKDRVLLIAKEIDKSAS